MDIDLLIKQMSQIAVGWPLMIYVGAISIIYTVALRGIQFRHFFTAWKATLFPSAKANVQEGGMSPFHAFMNTINSNLGNGSIAGMGTAVAIGGPGAAFWVFVFGFILMSVRFAEVYISALCGMQSLTRTALGGPMVYLKNIPGGNFLPYLYAIACFLYGILGGCAFQANSIQVSLTATWGISPLATGAALFVFVLYILCGGADRIVKISMTIVPVKIIVFVFGVAAVLGYHYAAIPAALVLIFKSAFGWSALAGGVLGFTMEQAIRSGMTSSIFATESGVGSAAILFGSTGSTDPIQSGMMGMVSTFLSMLAGVLIALCIVVSDVWASGLSSTALTIAAFETAMGSCGGWIVSFLSVSFGFGVLVSYAYIVRMLWLFLTNNRFPMAFVAIYSLCTFGGAVASVGLVWDLINLAVAGTLLINLYGLIMLLPKIRKDLLNQLAHYKA